MVCVTDGRRYLVSRGVPFGLEAAVLLLGRVPSWLSRLAQAAVGQQGRLHTYVDDAIVMASGTERDRRVAIEPRRLGHRRGAHLLKEGPARHGARLVRRTVRGGGRGGRHIHRVRGWRSARRARHSEARAVPRRASVMGCDHRPVAPATRVAALGRGSGRGCGPPSMASRVLRRRPRGSDRGRGRGRRSGLRQNERADRRPWPELCDEDANDDSNGRRGSAGGKGGGASWR